LTLPGNFICRPYRGVSVQHWTEALDELAVKGVLLTREAYRRTEFVVLRAGDGSAAVVRITTASQEALFNPITAVEWLAGPGDCAYLVRPDVDVANATALAEAALSEHAGQAGPLAAITIVEGRYQHVNFIVRPQALEVRLVDVVPPEPPRLLDLARQVITIDDNLPPVRLVPELLDVRALAAAAPDDHYLLPCRGAGLDLPGTVDYLDQRPARADWTMIGCERSRQFHRWFYGGEPDRQVELCPDRQPEGGRGDPDRKVLTLLRCCLLERGIRVESDRAVVPWGANLSEVQAALRALTGTDEGEIVWTRSTSQ
jgi:hypothetical protein